MSNKEETEPEKYPPSQLFPQAVPRLIYIYITKYLENINLKAEAGPGCTSQSYPTFQAELSWDVRCL